MIPAPRPTVCEQTVSFAWNALRTESARGMGDHLAAETVGGPLALRFADVVVHEREGR